MREIKFRGVGLHSKYWKIGNLITKTDAYGNVIKAFINNRLSGITVKNEYPLANMILVEEVDISTVSQYTGLKDKNGKEIYGGDIVKCLEVSEYATREYVSEVYFEDGCWLVHESKTCDVELYLYDNSNPTKMPLTEIEVLGSIYENPELLEVE